MNNTERRYQKASWKYAASFAAVGQKEPVHPCTSYYNYESMIIEHTLSNHSLKVFWNIPEFTVHISHLVLSTLCPLSGFWQIFISTLNCMIFDDNLILSTPIHLTKIFNICTVCTILSTFRNSNKFNRHSVHLCPFSESPGRDRRKI